MTRAFPCAQRSVVWWLSCLLWLGFGTVGRADAASDFADANRLYEELKFADALTAYSRILASGRESAALHFNLANAAFKQQRFGLALAHYRQAERLDPRAADIQQNLAATRARLGRGPGVESITQHLANRLTRGEWITLAGTAVWLTVAALFAVRWRTDLRARLGPMLPVLTAGAAVIVGLATVALTLRQMNRTGVTVLKDVKARFGPLEESKEAFALPEGAEVRVKAEQGKWLQVEAANQSRSGWVQRDHVVVIGPS